MCNEGNANYRGVDNEHPIPLMRNVLNIRVRCLIDEVLDERARLFQNYHINPYETKTRADMGEVLQELYVKILNILISSKLVF